MKSALFALGPVVPMAAFSSTDVLSLVMVAISSGFLVQIVNLRAERRRMASEARASGADAQSTEVDTQARIVENARREFAEMASKLDAAKTELGAARAELAVERRAKAEYALEIELLRRRVEQLHDEVLALRAQVGLGGRRADDDPQITP